MQRPFPVGGTLHGSRGKPHLECSWNVSFNADRRGPPSRTSKSKLAYWPALWNEMHSVWQTLRAPLYELLSC